MKPASLQVRVPPGPASMKTPILRSTLEQVASCNPPGDGMEMTSPRTNSCCEPSIGSGSRKNSSAVKSFCRVVVDIAFSLAVPIVTIEISRLKTALPNINRIGEQPRAKLPVQLQPRFEPVHPRLLHA